MRATLRQSDLLYIVRTLAKVRQWAYDNGASTDLITRMDKAMIRCSMRIDGHTVSKAVARGGGYGTKRRCPKRSRSGSKR